MEHKQEPLGAAGLLVSVLVLVYEWRLTSCLSQTSSHYSICLHSGKSCQPIAQVQRARSHHSKLDCVLQNESQEPHTFVFDTPTRSTRGKLSQERGLPPESLTWA